MSIHLKWDQINSDKVTSCHFSLHDFRYTLKKDDIIPKNNWNCLCFVAAVSTWLLPRSQMKWYDMRTRQQTLPPPPAHNYFVLCAIPSFSHSPWRLYPVRWVFFGTGSFWSTLTKQATVSRIKFLIEFFCYAVQKIRFGSIKKKNFWSIFLRSAKNCWNVLKIERI